MEKPRMGRPPKGGKPMGERLEIRVDPAAKADYERAAKAADMVLADWIRDTLSRAAKRALRADT